VGLCYEPGGVLSLPGHLQNHRPPPTSALRHLSAFCWSPTSHYPEKEELDSLNWHFGNWEMKDRMEQATGNKIFIFNRMQLVDRPLTRIEALLRQPVTPFQ